MGGVGKTALALRVIEIARPNFSRGVFWFEAGSNAVVLQPLLRSLIAFLGGESEHLDTSEQVALARELLGERTKSGAILLVIDNAPSEALEDIIRLLSALPPEVSLLLTGRDAAVAVSLDADAVSVGAMERAESRRLLELVSGLDLASASTLDANHLLDLLGDLPLAIALIGRQITLRSTKPGFTITALCSELEHFNATLLSFPGHRGIAASFALSYDALEEPARTIFRSIGKFADGPLAINDLADVNALGSPAAEELLDGLVSVSMLNWGGAPGEYRIHSLLHKYAAFQFELSAEPDRRNTSERFVRHFAAALKSAGSHGSANLAIIDTMFDNISRAIRGAADLRLDVSLCEMVLRLSAETDYFLLRNLAFESVPLLELAISAAQNLNDRNAIAAHTANLGNAYHRMGRLKEAFRHYEASIVIVRKTGNDYDLASNLQNLGTAMLSDGQDPAHAEKVLHEAFEASTRSQNIDALIGTLSALGGLCRQMGRLNEARKFYSDALRAARLGKVRLAEGNNLSNLGLIEQAMGRNEEAERMFREALAIAREIGDQCGEGNRLGHLAGLMTKRAESLRRGPEQFCLFESAREQLTEALRLARETRDAEKIACWLMNLGNTWIQTGNYSRTLELYTEALTVAVSSGYARIEAEVWYNLGQLHWRMQQPQHALREIQQAAKILRRLRSPLASKAEEQAVQIAHSLCSQDERR
jgi:tetratricopeptide (TPR) repeat protein